MHGSVGERRALEREALRNVIAQWNANRLDLFELSEPNEDLEFHGVMRFYFQDSGQKVATKCIRVASDATVSDVIETLIEKFRPDMRMLSVPSYALYEIHENCPERRLAPDEKPLLVQLNWHVDDREGRFLLKNIDDKSNMSSMGLSESNSSFRRKLSKREKKQLKKQEKLSRLKGDNDESNEKQDGVAEKLYTELPETSFTRSISNPEAVMRRRRQQKLERKLQQFRSKDGGPDTGGTLKIYGESLCRDVPYKTLLLSVRDCASAVVREMLEKYGLSRYDPSQWCLVQVTTPSDGGQDQEYVLDDDECPLSILMNHSNARGSIMFHVRRRPADCAPRKRKKKPGSLGSGGGGAGAGGGPGGGMGRGADLAPLLVELGPDGAAPHPGDVARTLRLVNDVMEVGSANGIALQLYGPHIQARHCVIANTDGLTSLTPCHADAHTYVNGQRIYQTTILQHGNLVKFGHSNAYQFLDPGQDNRSRHPSLIDNASMYDRSPRALSPSATDGVARENYETTFDLEGNVETVSTASAKDDNRSVGSVSDNRMPAIDRYPRGQDPILPAVLEFPEEPQEQFLARVITHLDVVTPSFKLSPAYTLYLCARYRASTHYRPELTPTERAHKLTLLLQHAAMLIRHTVLDRRGDSTGQAFWLANSSELLHFLKSDRHVSAFSLQAQDTLADSVQSAFRHLVACMTDELNAALGSLVSDTSDDHPNQIIAVLSAAMSLLRKCRVNAALTIQLFSQLFHWISTRSLSTIINNPALCSRAFGQRLFNRLRNLQAWAESQGLELAAECHLAKIVQCAHLLQAPKYSAEELANLSAACFKLNSLQLRALLTQYKADMGEQIPSAALIEQTARAAESVADELTRADGREVRLHEDTTLPVQLLLPDDGFSCDVVQGVPQGLAEFLQPLQSAGLCRLAGQPTSSGHWTVYMSAPRSPSALSATQPEVQIIRLHKAGGGMGLSIVAAKGAGQERLGIYIKSVVPGGAADLDGRLAAGDQLLSVDGQSLLGITQERAAEFLVRTGNTVALEVAKGGAVYHGLATLLQQPSPTPHRAEGLYHPSYRFHGSHDSLYGNTHVFSPRQHSSGFFSSDDSLFKNEMKKLTVPRISIEPQPIINIEITDFSEPDPQETYVVETCDCPKLNLLDIRDIKRKCGPQTGTVRRDLEMSDIPFIDDCKPDDEVDVNRNENGASQDLSSSQSSVYSTGAQELSLDLTSMDTKAPEKPKCWKSPDEVRLGYSATKAQSFQDDVGASTSEPELRVPTPLNKKTNSSDNITDKLSDQERMEVFKLLQDWSTFGLDDTIQKSIEKDTEIKLDVTNIAGLKVDQSNGAPLHLQVTDSAQNSLDLDKDDLSTVPIETVQFLTDVQPEYNDRDNKIDVCDTKVPFPNYTYFSDQSTQTRKLSSKYKSETDISVSANTSQNVDQYKSKTELYNKKLMDEWYSHKCKFKDCIFNEDNIAKDTLDSVLVKNDAPKEPTRPFNGCLVRNDSFDKLRKRGLSVGSVPKFPESYIVTRRKRANSEQNLSFCNCLECRKGQKVEPPKVVFVQKKLPKTWKSCSDIVPKGKTIRKCCKNAGRSCPMFKDSLGEFKHSQSCTDLSKTQPPVPRSASAKYEEFLDSPRRMSERDLPSRVDSERSIPSSKSVPALHHISQGPSENGRAGGHDVFNPGYSRTSSNNSINNNNSSTNNNTGAGTSLQNGNGGPQAAQGQLRSRSTHNLSQQDPGFYQNLSIYRNKMPSPQQLGDRTSALRSSQNSLHSTNTQRPASAYYPPTGGSVPRPTNLHQSIPNLKSPPSVHRLHAESEGRTSSYPSVSYASGEQQRQQQQQQQQGYLGRGEEGMKAQQQPPQSQHVHYPGGVAQVGAQYAQEVVRSPTGGYPQHGPLHVNAGDMRHQQGVADLRYQGLLREDVVRQSQHERSVNGRLDDLVRYPSSGNIKEIHGRMEAEQRTARQTEEATVMRPSKSEDMLRQHTREELMRYNSTNNVRNPADREEHQHHHPHHHQHQHQQKHAEDMMRHGRSEEALRTKEEMVRQHPINASLRGQAKMAEMGEEVRRRQNRVPGYNPPAQYQQNNAYYQQNSSPGQYPPAQQQQQQQQYYNQNQQYMQQALSPGSYSQGNSRYPSQPNVSQAQSAMQNLSLNTSFQQQQNTSAAPYHPNAAFLAAGYQQQQTPTSPGYQQQSPGGGGGGGGGGGFQQGVTSPTYNQTNFAYNSPISPSYLKSPPTAPKPGRKADEVPPELPPTTTHPLYSASMGEPPKGAFYPNTPVQGKSGPANPWEREEREKEMEARRIQMRQWRDQQIRELSSLSPRTPQQEEQLRTLHLEKEFERRAQEADQEDEDGEKESPPPQAPSTSAAATATSSSGRPDPPTSILKPGVTPVSTHHHHHHQQQQQQQLQQQQQVVVAAAVPTTLPPQEVEAPPPPERGSSYAIMSMRAKDTTKRVSFDTSGHNQGTSDNPVVHEDPNQFIAQAESMLASPTTPTDCMPGQPNATPGVIGAQEVYRDPRTRRLAEQAQLKSQGPVPEKLSFKEKMKMFAMETGEGGTPKDKSKISRAQREIDNISSPNSSLVH